jgi:GTP cyclohydrolase II
MNEDGSMAKRDELITFARKHKLSIGKIEDLIAYRLKKENFIKLKKTSDIYLGDQKFKIKIFENKIDGSEHFALIKGKITKSVIPRVRVISSNIVQNYLLDDKIPNSFNKTVSYFKKFKNCILVFIKDPNLKSVSATLKDYQNKIYYKKGKDKLIRNYGLGAQILKNLKVNKMILVTKSKKKVIGLEGYNLSITKQEII